MFSFPQPPAPPWIRRGPGGGRADKACDDACRFSWAPPSPGASRRPDQGCPGAGLRPHRGPRRHARCAHCKQRERGQTLCSCRHGTSGAPSSDPQPGVPPPVPTGSERLRDSAPLAAMLKAQAAAAKPYAAMCAAPAVVLESQARAALPLRLAAPTPTRHQPLTRTVCVSLRPSSGHSPCVSAAPPAASASGAARREGGDGAPSVDGEARARRRAERGGACRGGRERRHQPRAGARRGRARLSFPPTFFLFAAAWPGCRRCAAFGSPCPRSLSPPPPAAGRG